jgi:amicyanin
MKSNVISSSATIAIIMAGIFLVSGCTTQSPGGSLNGVPAVPSVPSGTLDGGTGDGSPSGGTGGGTPGGGAQTYSIDIKGFAFSPADLPINAGDTVVWTNSDSASHTVVFDSGSAPSSSPMSTGQTYSYTFTTAGTYAYHCSIHPSMKGAVTVS